MQRRTDPSRSNTSRALLEGLLMISDGYVTVDSLRVLIHSPNIQYMVCTIILYRTEIETLCDFIKSHKELRNLGRVNLVYRNDHVPTLWDYGILERICTLHHGDFAFDNIMGRLSYFGNVATYDEVTVKMQLRNTSIIRTYGVNNDDVQLFNRKIYPHLSNLRRIMG